MNTLLDKLNILADQLDINFEDEFNKLEEELSLLNPKFSSRKYQKESLGHFVYYMQDYKKKTTPIHLLFNLATGAGKTLLMAWLVGYLKEKFNYQHVIFLVNSKEIVGKTVMNFTDKLNRKYLFNSKLPFEIKVVDNFSALLPHQVGMKFTTLQGLSSELQNPGNGTLTYEDFKNNKILILADESHHLNADTKKGTKDEEKDKLSWEDLVKNALNSNLENILLEFTATIPNDVNVHAKYDDKIIYKYALGQYREDKYSKDVDLIKIHKRSDVESEQKRFIKDRILLACIMSQYKTDLFRELKEPITAKILFKSNKTDDNLNNLDFFKEIISTLKTKDIINLYNIVKSDFDKKDFIHFKDAFEYYKRDDFNTLVHTFKEVFTFDNEIKGRIVSKGSVRIVDTKNTGKESLDFLKDLDSNNSTVRVIFAVDMLNEGWDVLSLFDIARLYDSRSLVPEKTKTNNKLKTKLVVGPQTVKEAQLIGRGARYCPFSWKDLDKDRRKFDDYTIDEKHLSVLERLHYYSADDSMYITELKGQLINDGIIDENEIREKTIKINPIFKTRLKKLEMKLYLNNINFNNIKINKNNLNLNKNKFSIEYNEKITISHLIENGNEENFKNNFYELSLKQIHKNIIYKALNIQGVNFNWIQEQTEGFSSVFEFINKIQEQRFTLETKLNKNEILNKNNVLILSPKAQLSIVVTIIKKIKDLIFLRKKNISIDTYHPYEIFEIIKDEKTLRISGKNTKTELNINKNWFSHDKLIGTSYEIKLYEAIERYFENENTKLNKLKINEFFLLRNEREFKIFDNLGHAFEPDFVLFLLLENMQIKWCQVFIEPKGEHLTKNDKWKEEYLVELDFNDTTVKIMGLEFYTPDKEQKSYFEIIEDNILEENYFYNIEKFSQINEENNKLLYKIFWKNSNITIPEENIKDFLKKIKKKDKK